MERRGRHGEHSGGSTEAGLGLDGSGMWRCGHRGLSHSGDVGEDGVDGFGGRENEFTFILMWPRTMEGRCPARSSHLDLELQGRVLPGDAHQADVNK